MGFLIFLVVMSLLLIIMLIGLWCAIDKYIISQIILSVFSTILSLGVLIFAWFSVFTPATPYTNEENIARYETLIEKVENIDENTPASEMEKIYNEVEEWNEEYAEYQNNIGGFTSTRYPADRYVGCNEINFWESIK